MRDHYLIHYVVSGRGTFTAAGRAFPVRAGEVFLVWPNVVVSYEADTESPWEYYWLGFSGPDAAALLARTDLRPDAPVLHIDFGRTFQRYITAIYEARGQSAWSRTQMLGYAYLLLGKLIEGRKAQRTAEMSSTARRPILRTTTPSPSPSTTSPPLPG